MKAGLLLFAVLGCRSAAQRCDTVPWNAFREAITHMDGNRGLNCQTRFMQSIQLGTPLAIEDQSVCLAQIPASFWTEYLSQLDCTIDGFSMTIRAMYDYANQNGYIYPLCSASQQAMVLSAIQEMNSTCQQLLSSSLQSGNSLTDAEQCPCFAQVSADTFANFQTSVQCMVSTSSTATPTMTYQYCAAEGYMGDDFATIIQDALVACRTSRRCPDMGGGGSNPPQGGGWAPVSAACQAAVQQIDLPMNCSDPILSSSACTADEQALLKNCVCPLSNDVNMSQMGQDQQYLMQQAEKCILKPNSDECDQVVRDTSNSLQTCRDSGAICKMGADLYLDFPTAGQAVLEAEVCVPKYCHSYMGQVSSKLMNIPQMQQICPGGDLDHCQIPITCGDSVVGKRWKPDERRFGLRRRLQVIEQDAWEEAGQSASELLRQQMPVLLQQPAQPGQPGQPGQGGGPSMPSVISSACQQEVMPFFMQNTTEDLKCNDMTFQDGCTQEEQNFVKDCGCNLFNYVKGSMSKQATTVPFLMQQAAKCVFDPSGAECDKVVGETKNYLQKCRDSGDICKVGANLYNDFPTGAGLVIAQVEICLPQSCHAYTDFVGQKLLATQPMCQSGDCKLPMQCGKDMVGKVWDPKTRSFSQSANSGGDSQGDNNGGGSNGPSTWVIVLIVLLLVGAIGAGAVVWRKKQMPAPGAAGVASGNAVGSDGTELGNVAR